MIQHVGRRLGLLSSVILLATNLAQAQVDSAAAPKSLTTRLETEYKLAVPAGKGAAAWRWLSQQYAASKPKELGAGWVSSLNTEEFEDRYFDDDARTLLTGRAGLRHRRRFASDGTLKKQLVQFKLPDANDSAGMLRDEVKFKVSGDAEADAPLAELIRRKDRDRLDSVLDALHMPLGSIQPALLLHQRRQRLYLELDGDAYSTITLDSSYHAGRPSASFVEIEVELNEKRFTGASPAERQRMQVVMDGIRADLFAHIPGLQQDQRPKYQKLAALLPAGYRLRAAPAGGRDLRWLWGVLAGAGAGAVALALVRRWEKKKRTIAPSEIGA